MNFLTGWGSNPDDSDSDNSNNSSSNRSIEELAASLEDIGLSKRDKDRFLTLAELIESATEQGPTDNEYELEARVRSLFPKVKEYMSGLSDREKVETVTTLLMALNAGEPDPTN